MTSSFSFLCFAQPPTQPLPAAVGLLAPCEHGNFSPRPLDGILKPVLWPGARAYIVLEETGHRHELCEDWVGKDSVSGSDDPRIELLSPVLPSTLERVLGDVEIPGLGGLGDSVQVGGDGEVRGFQGLWGAAGEEKATCGGSFNLQLLVISSQWKDGGHACAGTPRPSHTPREPRAPRGAFVPLSPTVYKSPDFTSQHLSPSELGENLKGKAHWAVSGMLVSARWLHLKHWSVRLGDHVLGWG